MSGFENMNAVRKATSTLFLGLALVLGTALATPALAVTVKEVKSPGGVTAYLSEDHTTPVVAITFAFAGGSALDPRDKMGMSGLASSLLDEGAGDLDSFAFQSALEDLAISVRFNADRDMIRGQITTTTPNTARALDLMRLALTQPRFDPEPVERIRRQILVSIAARAENPGRLARKALMETVFGNHPYALEDDGTAETIAAVTVDDLRAWVKSRFARDRLIVAAAGDITPEALGKAMDMLFSSLPATSGLNATLPRAAVSTKGQTIRITKDLPQSVVVIAQNGFLRSDPDWYTATVLDYIFGGGSFASRLMNEVREKRGLAYSVSTGLAPYDAAGLVTASVGTQADQADTSLAIIREEWRKLRDKGPTAEELADAKQYLTGAWPLRFTSTGSIAEILLAVQRDKLGLDYIDKRNSLIEGVTLEDAKRVAKRLYDPDALTVVIVGPAPAPAASTTPTKPAKPSAKPAG
jgi:zinc protease